MTREPSKRVDLDLPEPPADEKAVVRARICDLADSSFTPSDYSGLTIAQVVESCARVYAAELSRLLLALDYDRAEAGRRAARLWRAVLPELTDVQATRAHVACVSWGLRLGLIDATEAKTMMFIAQNQLAVLKLEVHIPLVPPAPQPIETAPLFTGKTIAANRSKDVG